jgi:hypothetical protein
VEHVEKSLREISSLISDSGGQGYKCVHVRENVTPIDINHLAFYAIQNITGSWHVIIKE